MNTNVYGGSPNNMLPPQYVLPQTQQAQQQHQLPPQQFMSQPLTTNNKASSSVGDQMSYNPMQTIGVITSMPPSSIVSTPPQQQQSMLNGSHQQLTASMSGLAINPMKQTNSMPTLPQQQHTISAPPVSAAYNNQNVYSEQNFVASKTVPLAANNNNFAASFAPTPNDPIIDAGGQHGALPPTPLSTSGLPQMGSNVNQMTIKSGNLQGLPHMPPKGAAGLPTAGQMQLHSFPGQQQPPNTQQKVQSAYGSQPHVGYDPNVRPPITGYPPQSGSAYAGQLQPQSGTTYPAAQQPTMGYGAQIPPGARPGLNQHAAPGNVYQPPHMPAAAAQRRLDPDQMPNPIQVMIENQRNAGGPFVTNQVGLLPPLVTTNYVVQDQGNCSPRYVRSTLYTLPATADLQKTTSLPFSLIVSPFAKIVEGEFDPPIVDFGALGPIRCNRCKAYMSPNMQFIDAGRRFQCLMCKVSTEGIK